MVSGVVWRDNRKSEKIGKRTECSNLHSRRKTCSKFQNLKLFIDILDIEVFSTDESCRGGVHEIGIKRIDIDTERFTWLCADALVNNMDKFVDDPHVLFDMSDVGSLV